MVFRGRSLGHDFINHDWALTVVVYQRGAKVTFVIYTGILPVRIPIWIAALLSGPASEESILDSAQYFPEYIEYWTRFY